MTSFSDRPIAVDLFAGVGGMSLGFEMAGFDILAAVEIEAVHCHTHVFNFPMARVLCRDITKVSGRYIRDESAIGNRDIDVVFGGPPCQGFSIAGKRSLEDERNLLVFEFIRLVGELQPKYFVLENVKGLVQGDNYKLFFKNIIEAFGAIGYKVREKYRVLNAKDYGVPQDRERVFLLGCKENLSLPEYPIIKVNIGLQGSFVDYNTPCTVSNAIDDLPEIEQYTELFEVDRIRTSFQPYKTSWYSSLLRGFTKLFNDYSYPRSHDKNLLTASLRTKHSDSTIARFEATPLGKREPVSHFHKLDPDGLCPTLRAGTASNKGSHTAVRPIHPYKPRCITVREAARLHSFPDWFQFHPTVWHGFRQVGNSVPPLLAKAVAEEVMKKLK